MPGLKPGLMHASSVASQAYVDFSLGLVLTTVSCIQPMVISQLQTMIACVKYYEVLKVMYSR